MNTRETPPDDPALDRERPWDAEHVGRLLEDIAIALLTERGLETLRLELVAFYSLETRDFRGVDATVVAPADVDRDALEREAMLRFAIHEPGAIFIGASPRDQLVIAHSGTVRRSALAAHRVLAALDRFGG